MKQMFICILCYLRNIKVLDVPITHLFMMYSVLALLSILIFALVVASSLPDLNGALGWLAINHY